MSTLRQRANVESCATCVCSLQCPMTVVWIRIPRLSYCCSCSYQRPAQSTHGKVLKKYSYNNKEFLGHVSHVCDKIITSSTFLNDCEEVTDFEAAMTASTCWRKWVHTIKVWHCYWSTSPLLSSPPTHPTPRPPPPPPSLYNSLELGCSYLLQSFPWTASLSNEPSVFQFDSAVDRTKIKHYTVIPAMSQELE
jgi:hypothetical protein